MTIRWIAIDWGTPNLRAWAMGDAGPLAEATSQTGMGQLAPSQFEPALIALIAPWLTAPVTRVLSCGMIGARQGWQEAPYRQIPCSPLAASDLLRVRARDPRLDLYIAPGLIQPEPADVMRGEETRIAGVLAQRPDFGGIICHPGTHSKWVQIADGKVIAFQTYLTSELFALLSTRSVLRHGLAEGWDDTAFDQGVDEALSRPEKIAARLFSLRAEFLLHGLDPAKARARLSGLLIGIELAGAKSYWLGGRIMLVGSASLAAGYDRALKAQGLVPELLDATTCTLAGLQQLHLMMEPPQ